VPTEVQDLLKARVCTIAEDRPLDIIFTSLMNDSSP